MIRRHLTLAAVAVAAAALLVTGPGAGSAAAASPDTSEPGDRYVSNPPEEGQLVAYCEDQAQLANNLEMQGDHDRAQDVVGAANIRGCRIYTFEAGWAGW